VASVKDIEQVTDDLERLVGQMRSEIRNGPDFAKLVEIVDEISEHADNAATTFNSMNEALMSRLSELGGKGQGGRSRSDGSSAREKAESTAQGG
jgi:hypothetical protein